MKFEEYFELVKSSLFADDRFSLFKASCIPYLKLKQLLETIDFEQFHREGSTSLADETCCVCIESLDRRADAILTKCGHLFHPMCLLGSLQSHRIARKCPLCRAEFLDLLPSGMDGAILQFLQMVYASVFVIENCHQDFTRLARRQSRILRNLKMATLDTLDDGFRAARTEGLRQDAACLCHMLRVAGIFLYINYAGLYKLLNAFDALSPTPIASAFLETIHNRSFHRDLSPSGELHLLFKQLRRDFDVTDADGGLFRAPFEPPQLPTAPLPRQRTLSQPNHRPTP
jgi:hypothetical protein